MNDALADEPIVATYRTLCHTGLFQRTVDGLQLAFHLAGINNQNFFMQDEQTGTYWQQITGLAISGPLAGRRLQSISADELSFARWRKEQPGGTVLNDVPGNIRDYASKDWDKRIAKAPTVFSYAHAVRFGRSVNVFRE